MVTMTAIWDRTACVLRARARVLAGIAALLVFAPAVVGDALSAYGSRGPGWMAAGGIVGLLAAIATIWGNLALVAAAGGPAADDPALDDPALNDPATADPAVARAVALRLGARRVPLALLLAAVAAVVATFLLGLALAMLGAGTADLAAMAGGTAPAMTGMGTATGMETGTVSPGLVLGAVVFLFVLLVLAVWLGARLALVWPVVVEERRGIGSFARSFALTRGITRRIVGVSVLFAVVVLVALAAAQLVVSVAVRLMLGAGGIATARFAGSVAGALVTAAAVTVAATFVAQLYRVRTGRDAAHTAQGR